MKMPPGSAEASMIALLVSIIWPVASLIVFPASDGLESDGGGCRQTGEDVAQ